MPSPRFAVVHLLIVSAVVIGVVGAVALPAQPDPVILSTAAKCDFSSQGAMPPSPHGGMLMPTSADCTAFRPALNMQRWSISASSSAKGHTASAAIRGGART